MRNSARVVLLLVLIAAFALRLHELTKQNIWWDEARNIDVALRPFWQIPTAPELDIHPPVYFWLLHLWSRLLGLGDSTQLNVAAIAQPNELTFIVRSLSAFMNVLGIALLAHLARLWPGSGTTIGLFAVGIASAAPFWLAESQETRMYTLGFTLILAGAICLLRTTIRSIPSNQQERLLSQPHLKSPTNLLFILFAALSLLTHYNALFIVVAWYLWWGGWALLRPNRWLWIRHITITGLLMSAVVLPIAPIALRQIPGYSNPNLTVPTIAEYFTANWRAYFGGYAFPPNQQGLVSSDALWSGWLWTIGGIVLLGLLLIFWQSFSVVAAIFTENASNPPTSKQPPSKPAASKSTVTLGHVNGNLRQITKVQQQTILSFLLVWLIGGLGLYYIAVIDRGAFNPRYSSFVTPALYLLVALALSAWTFKSPLVGKAASIVGLAIIGFGFVPSVHADLYDDRFAREDMAQTVSWLNENAGWGDIIFVDQKYPFGFYYDRFVIGADEDYPVGSTTEKRPPARYLFVDINTIDQRLNQWAATADRIYWLQWFESDTDPRGSVRFLLDQHGTWAGVQRFRGYTVEWWELEPPTQFSLAPNMTAATYIFPPAVETVELSLPQMPISAGETAPVAIRWKRVTEGWTDRPLKARVAVQPSGRESRLAQDDRPILNDRHLMPAEWNKEDRPLNVYAIQLPIDIEPGVYDLRLLLYDAETLAPLTYVDLAGNPAGIEAVIGSITVK